MKLSGDNDKEPDITPVSRLFHQRMVSYNNLGNQGFQEWLFHQAMLFGSNNKWWGDFGKRDISHEGLDLCYFRTDRGDIQHLTEKTRVPAMFDGQVVKVCNDFLGESVFVRHDLYSSNESRLYTIYGHIKPGEQVYPGERLAQGDIIGMLANKRDNKGVVPFHLHISAAWISDLLNREKLGWQILRDADKVKLLNPLTIIECPYSISSDL